MKISTIVTPEQIKKWNDFIKKHPNNTVFQSHEMYRFYGKVKNFEPHSFFAIDESNEIIGKLLAVLIKEGKGLKGYFSSRVVVYGGPLIKENSSKLQVLELLLDSLVKNLKNKSVFIQFRNFFQWNNFEKKVFAKYKFKFRDRLNLIIDTKDKQKVWKDISESRRRQIKKGLNSNGIIQSPQNEDDVKTFYDLLFQLYKNKVKKPLPDWSFFKAFYEFSKNGKLGIIKLLKKDNKVIGGILSPVTEGKGIYEWYVVGLDKEYKAYYPSILVTWSAIECALNNNLDSFDFMGLGLPHIEYGVRDFKLRFGGEMVNYGRFGRRNNKYLYALAEFGYNFLRLARRL